MSSHGASANAFDSEYVPDGRRVIERYRAWWNNDCLARPVTHLICKRPTPTQPLLKLPDLSENLLERHLNTEYRLTAVKNRVMVGPETFQRAVMPQQRAEAAQFGAAEWTGPRARGGQGAA